MYCTYMGFSENRTAMGCQWGLKVIVLLMSMSPWPRMGVQAPHLRWVVAKYCTTVGMVYPL